MLRRVIKRTILFESFQSFFAEDLTNTSICNLYFYSQPTTLFAKIRSCKTLEEDTDLKLKQIKEHPVDISDIKALNATLKGKSIVSLLSCCFFFFIFLVCDGLRSCRKSNFSSVSGSYFSTSSLRSLVGFTPVLEVNFFVSQEASFFHFFYFPTIFCSLR